MRDHPTRSVREEFAVQIVQINNPASTTGSASTSMAADVVSPTRLFAAARARIDGAMATLRHADGVIAPTALATSIAVDQVQAGISVLRSVLVPTTTATYRHNASAAIDYATRGIVLLDAYAEDVRPLGDDAFTRSSLPATTRLQLDRGLSYLTLAINRIR